MNTFANAVKNQGARTANGMKARKSTANACVDLFYKIGASRGKNIVPDFVAAYAQDREVALRIALWARDIRGGAGERKLFRDILNYLAKNDPDAAGVLMLKTPELGRWDDLLAVEDEALQPFAFSMIGDAIATGNGLAAKWMPRKGVVAVKLREYLGMTPKTYRKTLVNLTNVVETQMCAKDWDSINFNHVPSVASSRYKKAFNRHTTKYKEWVAKLTSTDPKVRAEVKINAGAVYPYDVLKGKIGHYMGNANYNKTELDAIIAQWDALPNYMGDHNVLPLVDVSGSMTCPVGDGGKKTASITCLDVAVSLGLYCADKNSGPFKGMFLTFSTSPELLHLKGDVIQKIDQMVKSKWGMSTNLHAAFDAILTTAKKGKVAAEDMPKMLLIMSDMQFNSCTRFDDSAIQMMRRKYEDAGYVMPMIVFWNINAYDNTPVKHDERGVVLVSGFSPVILKSVLGADFDNFTPAAMMMKVVMQDRYNLG